MIENYSTTYIAVQTDTTPSTLVRISKNLDYSVSLENLV